MTPTAAATSRKPKPVRSVVAEPAYTVDEVADHLRVERTVVYNLIRDGSIRATRVGRLIRISESALAAFLAGE